MMSSWRSTSRPWIASWKQVLPCVTPSYVGIPCVTGCFAPVPIPLFVRELSPVSLLRCRYSRYPALPQGFDMPLARHFAHLFIRDPIVVYQELLDQDDRASSDHFENIQSTNWQNMRFKPPPPDSDIGGQ